ncbi:MAG: PEP-CTERM/exosortase system-associated acyltransferase [Vulcanimicrobiaceae bacterium]
MPYLDQPQSPSTTPLRANSLVEVYRKVFISIPADTPELQDKAYRLRYQVYCVEREFEDPTQYPDGLERDAYDDHAVQALLLHRASRETVGTVRLVLHRRDVPTHALPFFAVCGDRLPPWVRLLPRETTAELSRFAISKAFRQRAEDGAYGKSHGIGELDFDPRRVIPSLTLGLMTEALRLGTRHGVEHVCAIMEPSLLRLVARFGFHFEPVGRPVEYHGLRQPCYANVDALIAGVEAERPDVWEVLTDRGRLWKPICKPVAEFVGGRR